MDEKEVILGITASNKIIRHKGNQKGGGQMQGMFNYDITYRLVY